MEVSDSSLG